MSKLLFNYGQDIVMAFSPPVVGCLVKKGLQKGRSEAPPGYTPGGSRGNKTHCFLRGQSLSS